MRLERILESGGFNELRPCANDGHYFHFSFLHCAAEYILLNKIRMQWISDLQGRGSRVSRIAFISERRIQERELFICLMRLPNAFKPHLPQA